MKNKKKIDTKSKFGSILLLISVVAIFFLGVIGLAANFIIFYQPQLDKRPALLFAFGLLSTIAIFYRSALTKFRTIVHESKHAVVVLLTGNKLKEFKISNGSAYVTFDLYKDKLNYAPLISLAPYYFPLFSLPLFIFAIFIPERYRAIFSLFLGSAIALDILTGIFELHPKQTDLSRIFGGFLVAGSLIGGILFFWFNFCFLWSLAGKAGLVLAIKIFVALFSSVLQSLLS